MEKQTGPTFKGPILIVASNASDRFGGEAVLPLHYFRGLRDRGVDVWLLTHARVRDELADTLRDDIQRVVFIEDTWLHRLFWRMGSLMPQRVASAWHNSTLDLVTQFAQRAIARRMVHSDGIRVVHQPTPVSPKSPSLMFGIGAPVIIGPMNGGMEYPPEYRRHFEGRFTRMLIGCGRLLSHVVNLLLPGKRFAAKLLVANTRTLQALPLGCKRRVTILVENGVVNVDSLAEAKLKHLRLSSSQATFVFVGRLIDLKGVDLLLEAFARLPASNDMLLSIIGDGPERSGLQALAGRLGVEKQTRFYGYLPRVSCIEAICNATALVLPSLKECGGAVVLEAMSVGTPVIAADWGGPSDYIDDSCGILIPPGTFEAFVNDLCTAMEELASNHERAAEMGCCGLERAHRFFTWDAKIDQILDHYASVSSNGDHAQLR